MYSLKQNGFLVLFLILISLSFIVLDSKAIDLMNALMRLNQIRPGLQYKLLSQSGPVHAPVFTMSVDVDGTTYEASGPSKKTAKLHVAVKVQYSFTD
jgi:perinuclear RNA-binding protein